jgi:predicted transposase YbfD/YdcC
LAVVALLAGMSGYEAIVRYGQERGWDFLQHLGFTRRRGLCKATYSRVLRRIDVADFEDRVGRWIRGRLGPADVPQIALDGKTARGSRDGGTPGVHLVAAYAPQARAVLAQIRVDAKTNEHKAAPELLGVLPVAGKVVTGDAMFTHRDVCARVVDGGAITSCRSKTTDRSCGPTSRRSSPSPRPAFPPLRTTRRDAAIERASEVDKGHGRIEARTIEVSGSLARYLGGDWPGTARVFRLTRVRTTAEKVETEVVLGITSLPGERAGARDLLKLTRNHWGIESMHHVRDGTSREDARRIRKGSGPEVMACLRNIAIVLLERMGFKNAAATRHFVCHPEKTHTIVSTSIPMKRPCGRRPPSPARLRVDDILEGWRLGSMRVTTQRAWCTGHDEGPLGPIQGSAPPSGMHP